MSLATRLRSAATAASASSVWAVRSSTVWRIRRANEDIMNPRDRMRAGWKKACPGLPPASSDASEIPESAMITAKSTRGGSVVIPMAHARKGHVHSASLPTRRITRPLSASRIARHSRPVRLSRTRLNIGKTA
ncbi:hypothetical protein PJL18_04301 [Paenarthrobacter nicotinovorans]|nr:hypothetical protein [Paenarthrobacter nicotinovorans]